MSTPIPTTREEAMFVTVTKPVKRSTDSPPEYLRKEFVHLEDHTVYDEETKKRRLVVPEVDLSIEGIPEKFYYPPELIPEHIRKQRAAVLTEQTVDKILEAIRRGNTRKNACLVAGITLQYFNAVTKNARKTFEYMVMRHQTNIQNIERQIEQAVMEEQVTILIEKLHKVITEHTEEVDYLKENNIYFRAYQEVTLAEAQLEDSVVFAWYNMRHTDWKAAKEFLAKRFSKDWSENALANKRALAQQQQLPQGPQQSINVNVLQQAAVHHANGALAQLSNNPANQNQNPISQLTVGITNSVQAMDLSNLTQEELDHFEQLLTKIPNTTNDSDGEIET